MEKKTKSFILDIVIRVAVALLFFYAGTQISCKTMENKCNEFIQTEIYDNPTFIECYTGMDNSLPFNTDLGVLPPVSVDIETGVED